MWRWLVVGLMIIIHEASAVSNWECEDFDPTGTRKKKIKLRAAEKLARVLITLWTFSVRKSWLLTHLLFVLFLLKYWDQSFSSGVRKQMGWNSWQHGKMARWSTLPDLRYDVVSKHERNFFTAATLVCSTRESTAEVHAILLTFPKTEVEHSNPNLDHYFRLCLPYYDMSMWLPWKKKKVWLCWLLSWMSNYRIGV